MFESPQESALHVYEREIKDDERTSLSVLAARIAPGARVLDLGCGSGALGRFLNRRDGPGVPIDGLTISQAEAECARVHYRRVLVADLEQADLGSMFTRGAYDVIVCADVLEHVRQSARVLRACGELLAPGGVALLSIPNAGYCGLIAELMAGEFRYRQEGLLDATHVRFFTRATLLRFLAENGWCAERLEIIARELPDSEFHAAFDALPPAVARYLLALPDALTYQFVVQARLEGQADTVAHAPEAPAPAVDALPRRALFSAELFWSTDGRYDQARKLTARGEIGRERQTLRFDLPAAAGAPITSLKLDLADRPGFIHLYGLTLTDRVGAVLWHWTPGDVAAMAGARHGDLIFAPPALSEGSFVALMYGDDPWIELPISPQALAGAADGALKVELGWPMSADYLALAGLARARIAQAEHECEQMMAQLQDLQHEREQMVVQLQDAQHEREQMVAQLQDAQHERVQMVAQLQDAQHEREQMVAQLQALQHEREQMVAQLQDAQHECGQMVAQLQDLQQLRSVEQRQQAQSLASAESQAEQVREQRLELIARTRDLSRERDEARQLVRAIETTRLFRATRPIVRAKLRFERLIGKKIQPRSNAGPISSAPSPIASPTLPVDVIVPVYRGLEDTRRCIESVLRAVCQTPWRLILINDASPEPELATWLRGIATTDARITLLEHEPNLGFVGSVNRGMAQSQDNDVLLLNSDTEVADGWLDRLRAPAYSDRRVATVTPFSNNATICSYPRFCQDNDLPEGWDTARLDALCARVNAGQTVDVPTGVGFCMYIRRAALTAVGPFDEEHFGKGYGEENDFCVRAQAAGWRNLHALDVFVRHCGGVSFGAAKGPRERAAMETLRRLHPRYEGEVLRFIQADPARLARYALDAARVLDGGKPVILAVLHDRNGGTERHVFELASLLRQQARFLVLRPAPNQRVTLRLAGADEAFELSFALGSNDDLPSETGIRDEHGDDYVALLAILRAFGVCHVHYHHRMGHGVAIAQLARRLGLAYDFTAHDYYTICPQITLTGRNQDYCGEQGECSCNACLQCSSAPDGQNIVDWRRNNAAFFNRARFVIVPSRAAWAHLQCHMPTAPFRLVPHTDIDPRTPPDEPHPPRLEGQRSLKVAVIGALSVIKGADLLEDAAAAASRIGAPVEFHLLGYGYRALKTQPSAYLTAHGQYAEADLPGLLTWLQPDVVWFPARWPETYSYTLSACLQGGWPVVAPDIGAFPERLAGRSWTWIEPWQSSAVQWLAFFMGIRERHYLTGTPPVPPLPVLPELPASVLPGLSPRDWYAGPYLTELPRANNTGELTPELRALIAAHLLGRRNGDASLRNLRRLTLQLLVRARAWPPLAGLVRSIPYRWQTRTKSWLLK